MKVSIALVVMAGVAGFSPPPPQVAAPKKDEVVVEKPPTKPMYTTYFYTAREAVIHGYEADTRVRVVSLEKRGTIWEGVVGPGDTRVVQTGQGVFGFIADKKATILVGTPTSCTVVGYYLKDEKGSFKSNRFFAQLPGGGGGAEHFVIWAYEPTFVQLFKKGESKAFKSAELSAGGFLDVTGKDLAAIAGTTVELKATGKGVTAQVYYDEGFMVPAENGRGSGKRFLTYVGTITERVNDLNIIAQGMDAKVTVRDLKTKKVVFEGAPLPDRARGLGHRERLPRHHLGRAVAVLVLLRQRADG